MKVSRFIYAIMALVVAGILFPLTSNAVTDDANNLIVGPGETYTLGGVKTYAVGVQVAATGVLCVAVYTGGANTGYLELNAPTITVAGTINGDGRGYVGSQGPGTTYSGGGAGYGGVGGLSGSDGPGGASYGTSNGSDIAMGSGGGLAPGYAGPQGGNGGARVVLKGASVTVSGTVRAYGNAGPNYDWGAGGGSGGGIYLSGRAVVVSGTLAAVGGAGGNGSWGGGGGAGGRIKIFYCTLSMTGGYAVNGGAGGTGNWPGAAGGAGTYYTQSVPQPSVITIVDVKNDQGRFVRLTWSGACGDNASGNPQVTHYTVWRRIDVLPSAMNVTKSVQPMRVLAYPPGTWDFVAEVPARGEASYNTVVPTLADSNSTGRHYSVFFVSGVTANPFVFYDSAPDSGYSVDNLPPVPPAPFTGAYASGATYLHWGENTEPDLWYYAVYRGSTEDFVPGPGNLIASQADTGYVDVGPAGGYYKLSAVDANGNESGYALLTPSETAGVEDGEALCFALGAVRPNPMRGDRLSVEFVLARTGAARLELLDVAGRRVIGREVGVLGIGRHQVDLASGARLKPGLYLVRLVQGPNSRTTRVAVLR